MSVRQGRSGRKGGFEFRVSSFELGACPRRLVCPTLGRRTPIEFSILSSEFRWQKTIGRLVSAYVYCAFPVDRPDRRNLNLANAAAAQFHRSDLPYPERPGWALPPLVKGRGPLGPMKRRRARPTAATFTLLTPHSWILNSPFHPGPVNTLIANLAAAIRVSTPSLANSLLLCFLIVCSVVSRIVDISGLVFPSVIQ